MTVLFFIKIFVYCIIIVQIANKVGCKKMKFEVSLSISIENVNLRGYKWNETVTEFVT
jgi:hypothetical protein